MTTKPINNTGLGFKRQVLCIFRMSRNLWDFAFEQEKNKSKPKDFAMCVAESKRQFAPVASFASKDATRNTRLAVVMHLN